MFIFLVFSDAMEPTFAVGPQTLTGRSFVNDVDVDQRESREEQYDNNYLLPAIVPGGELQVCGYLANGAVSCIYQWFRLLSDGSIEYIEGGTGPNYIVTLGDVGNLGIQVIPMDEN